MMTSSQPSVSELLEAVSRGETAALDHLYPLVYEELRKVAHRQRRGWHGDYTLDTVALVGEAYLKLVDQTSITLKSRAHFFAVAARAMRQILLDYAKKRQAQKRGGDFQRVSFDEMRGLFDQGLVLSKERADILVALEEALERLATIDERQCQVVECRFFGGMTIEDTAAVLDVSTATVNRDWKMARSWLHREIQRILGS